MDDQGVPPPVEFSTVTDPSSWQRMSGIAILLALLTMLLSVGVLAYQSWADARADERDSRVRLEQTERVAELRTEVERLGAIDADAREAAECRLQHTNQVTETQATFLLAIGDGLIALALEDEPGFRRVLDRLRLTQVPYREAADARLAYEAAGSPLPCPLNGD
jgi:hypothetical protein